MGFRGSLCLLSQTNITEFHCYDEMQPLFKTKKGETLARVFIPVKLTV